MREDISAYEEAAIRFEQEEQILRELVQQETKGSYSLYATHKYCLKSTHITNNNPTDNECDALCGVSFSTHP